MNNRKIFYHTERSAHYLNNIIILVTFVLAFFWVVLNKAELEAWIALFGMVSILLSKAPYLLEKFGYNKYPLGKGVISKGGCWIGEGKEQHKIKLSVNVDKFKTKIDYIPTGRVMAHISDDYLIFKRRAGDPGHRLRVDYELIKKD